MTLILQLPDQLEQNLRAEAARQGLSLEYFVKSLLASEVMADTYDDVERYTEDELLQLIQAGPDAAVFEEYKKLRSMFESGVIEDSAHDRLLILNEVIEVSHAKRMHYLKLLSKLRTVDLDTLLAEFSLKH